jgi:DNA polymerase-1
MRLGTPARLIMQVHDELVLEVANSAVDETVRQLREYMARAAELTVPLKVDIGIGPNWDKAH